MTFYADDLYDAEWSTDFSFTIPNDLKSGGFIGFAWNRPFGRENDQLGIAAVLGKPTRYQRELGYNTQYGIESFWRFNLGSSTLAVMYDWVLPFSYCTIAKVTWKSYLDFA
jgi:hypothetical protein